MPTIAIDCRFASQRVGLGTYVRELVPRLMKRMKDVSFVLLVQSEDDEWLREIPKDRVSLIPFKDRHYSFGEQIHFQKYLKASNTDLLFSPHFNVPLSSPIPFVVTIHDLILHRFPNSASFFKRAAYKMLIKRAVTNATGIIAVSKYTKKEIESIYGNSIVSKVTHITEGVSDAFRNPHSLEERSNVLERYELREGFFLYVGNAKHHKNVQLLLDAHKASGVSEELILVMSGKEKESLRLHTSVRIIEEVPPQDLPALYSSAKCFVTASLYEGFCLPIIEARACSTPVIAVNQTAIPEVAGKDAILLEPTLEAFVEAFKNPPTVATPLEAEYNWDSTAEQTARFLRSHLPHG